uniref:EamA domain-containing protein n=1 Tax=Cafeteria roenbergensis TaxID=33653 RepID=A0A7S0PCE8_CAFRO
MAEQNERQLLLLGMLLVGLLVMCGILTIAAWALGGDSLGKPPPEAASARQLMQWRAADMLRWIALWFSAAITLTLWNRWLLSELFQAPLVVTGVHFAVQSGISWIIVRLTLGRQFVPSSVAMALGCAARGSDQAPPARLPAAPSSPASGTTAPDVAGAVEGRPPAAPSAPATALSRPRAAGAAAGPATSSSPAAPAPPAASPAPPPAAAAQLLRSRPSFWALVSPIAVATASDVCLSNLAVSLVPVWLYTVGKSTSLCFTYAAAVALGLQRFRLRAAGLIAVVFVGVALAAVGGEKGPLAASRAPPAAPEPAGAYGPPPEPGPTDPGDAPDAPTRGRRAASLACDVLAGCWPGQANPAATPTPDSPPDDDGQLTAPSGAESSLAANQDPIIGQSLLLQQSSAAASQRRRLPPSRRAMDPALFQRPLAAPPGAASAQREGEPLRSGGAGGRQLVLATAAAGPAGVDGPSSAGPALAGGGGDSGGGGMAASLGPVDAAEANAAGGRSPREAAATSQPEGLEGSARPPRALTASAVAVRGGVLVGGAAPIRSERSVADTAAAPDADDADGAGESLPDAAAAESTEGSVAGSALAVGAIAAVAAAAANAARWVTTERLLRQVSDAVADGEVGGGLQLGAAPLDRGAGGAGGVAAAEAAADDDDGSASTSTGGIVWAQRSGCAGDGGESAAARAPCADSEGAMAGAVVRSRAGTDADFGAESSVGVVVASGSTGRDADGGGAHGRGADGGSGDDDCRSDDTSPTPHREPVPLRRDGSDSLGDFASLDDAESLDLESLSGRPNVAIPVSGGALANRDDDAVAERAGLIQRGSSQEGVAASNASPAPKRRRRLDPLFVMAWTAPLCAVMTFVVALPVEGFAAAGSPAWDAVPTSVMAVVGTLAGALLAFVMIGAELQVISRASAITMTVAGHVKEALVIGLGAIVLGETVGVAEAAGIALVLLGTTAFGVLERGGGAHGGAGSGSGSGGDSGSAGAASAGAGTAGGGQRSPSLAQSPSAAAAAAAAKAEAMAVAAGARAAAHGHVDGAL